MPGARAVGASAVKRGGVVRRVRVSSALLFAVVVSTVSTVSAVLAVVLPGGFAVASAGAPTDDIDSAAGRAVFIVMTLAIIVVAVILSLKYRKR